MGKSTGQKRLLAIVVVAVVVVAGVGGVILLTQQGGPSYVTPGVSDIPYNRIIRVGILDPMTEIQGKGCYNGAWLAAYEINKAGGVNINGTIYYFGLISEDTYEAEAQLDTSKGVAAAQKIISVDQAQFLMGGFRTESLKSYIETVMDKKIIFIGTGAATDYFCQNVRDSYARYKYFFRIMPINSTALGKETITELAVLKYVVGSMIGNLTGVHKWAIIREDLDWTLPMVVALKAKMVTLGYDLNPVAEKAYPLTATATDFAGYWSDIQAAGAQIVVPIISAQGGILMTTQYNITQPKCLIVGIDVQSQLDSFWTDTAGKCMYEVSMQPIIGTNKTPLTIPFWNNYIGNFSGATPLYTATGGYDTIYMLRYAINKTQSFNNDLIITTLEALNRTNYLIGASGRLAFQQPPTYSRVTHDVDEGWPYGVTLWVQWQSGGAKPCITSTHPLAPSVFIYPNSIVTGTLALPPQGINPG